MYFTEEYRDICRRSVGNRISCIHMQNYAIVFHTMLYVLDLWMSLRGLEIRMHHQRQIDDIEYNHDITKSCRYWSHR